MKNSIRNFLILVIAIASVSCLQENKKNITAQEFAFTKNNWRIENVDGSTDTLKVVDHQGKYAMFLEPSQKAYLKDKEFKNFQLEFHCNGQVPGLGFRVQDKENYEYLYLRMMMSGKKDALQYIPIYNGSLPWQLYNYPKYEGNAEYPRKEVAILSPFLENQLVQGKVSDKLLKALEEKGIVFSEESFLDFPDETISYIYDPQSNKALLFEKRGDGIVFLDISTWVHVKVEVIADRMSVYVEDLDTPTFVVDNLKRNSKKGGIILYSTFGQVYFSDVSIREIESSNAPKQRDTEKMISPNYLTKWQISEPFAKDSVNFISQVDSLFDYREKFKTVTADMDGLLNISRFYDDMDKTIALTCTIVSDSDRNVKLNFDYADHLVILLNSEVLFDGGMNFRPPLEKGTEGRVFVDDEQTVLNLSKGPNELTFVLSGDNRQKYNWGCVAKLENLDGISIE